MVWCGAERWGRRRRELRCVFLEYYSPNFSSSCPLAILIRHSHGANSFRAGQGGEQAAPTACFGEVMDSQSVQCAVRRGGG